MFVLKFSYSTKVLLVFNYLLCVLKIFQTFNFRTLWEVQNFLTKNFSKYDIYIVYVVYFMKTIIELVKVNTFLIL